MSSRLGDELPYFLPKTATLQGLSTSTLISTPSHCLHYYYGIIFFEHGKVLLHPTHEALLLWGEPVSFFFFGLGSWPWNLRGHHDVLLDGAVVLVPQALERARPRHRRAIEQAKRRSGIRTPVDFHTAVNRTLQLLLLGLLRLALEPNQDDDFFLAGSGDMSPLARLRWSSSSASVGAASSPARRFDCDSGT